MKPQGAGAGRQGVAVRAVGSGLDQGRGQGRGSAKGQGVPGYLWFAGASERCMHLPHQHALSVNLYAGGGRAGLCSRLRHGSLITVSTCILPLGGKRADG